jgi:glycosyltransferase involved in cell wall biosynthesis
MIHVLQLIKKNIPILMVTTLILFSNVLFGVVYNPFLEGYNGQPELVVLVTSYNNEAFFYRNLDSIVYQKLDIPFRVIYVNDCSTDRTGELVDSYIRTHNCESFCTVIHNEKRFGSALANQYNVIHTLPDHTIVVLVDGDDFLAHDRVLERVLKEYKNKNVWMTYGQMIYYPEGGTLCEPCSQEVLEENSFRSARWVTSHLRTCYAGLFKRIKKQDLLYQGDFFHTGGDFAFMYPMLEMASKGHISFIPDVLYVYNHHNPISDHNKDLSLQIQLSCIIRYMPKYEPIEYPN